MESNRAATDRAGSPQAGEPARCHARDALRQAILGGQVEEGRSDAGSRDTEVAGQLLLDQPLPGGEITAEDLVERIPNRGARVRVVSLDEAIAITECRMVLEGLCAAKAAERVTQVQAAHLRELGDALRRAVSDGETLKYSALNQDLHRLVREISGQEVAAGLLERLHAQLVRHQFRLALRPGRPQVSLREHLAIIAAICDGRPEDAKKAAQDHLRIVIGALREASRGE